MDKMFLLFFIYSFFGWLFEVARTGLEKKQYVNKGFLNLCFCPSYGIAMTATMVILEPLKASPVLVFLGAIMVAVTVEFLTSVFLEKITGSRWWDYSNKRLHFEGRISFPFSIARGVAGVIGFYLTLYVIKLTEQYQIPRWGRHILFTLSVVLLLDCAVAVYTAMSIQSDLPLLLRLAEQGKNLIKNAADKLVEAIYIRTKKRELYKKTQNMRRLYRKEREIRRKKWLQQRMILAAPGLAPDEETLKRMQQHQKDKKKKMFRRIMVNRVLFTGIFLIIQIIWLFVLLTRFAALSSRITLIMTGISLLISLYVYSKRENSAYRLSWILIIMAMPVFGGLLYLFFGNKNPSRQMRTQLDRIHKDIKGKGLFEQDESIMAEIEKEDKRTAGRCRYLHSVTDAPIRKNTKTTYYPLGEDLYDDMIEDLKKAEHFIFMEYFIVEEGIFWGSILEVLEQKAKEGVDVRVIYDDIGCLTVLPEKYEKELEKKGISSMVFNPFKPILSLAMNNRDHRKILVIDGHTAYTGGINLADEYINLADRFGQWKDTAMKFHGEAAENFTLLFLEMWNAFCRQDEEYEPFLSHAYHPEPFPGEGYVQPFGDTPLDDDPTAENLYIDILNQASHYVYIYTPYLIISDVMQHALCMAAQRGVDVKIMTPGIPDKKIVFRMTRSNYRELLKAGVEIYEYTPGFLHAKSYISDDEHAVIGTINMDYRSLYLHFECGAYLYRTPTIWDMKQDFLATLDQALKIELKYMGQGMLSSVFDSVLAFLSPLV